jgi:hypothetical protein
MNSHKTLKLLLFEYYIQTVYGNLAEIRYKDTNLHVFYYIIVSLINF